MWLTQALEAHQFAFPSQSTFSKEQVEQFNCLIPVFDVKFHFNVLSEKIQSCYYFLNDCGVVMFQVPVSALEVDFGALAACLNGVPLHQRLDIPANHLHVSTLVSNTLYLYFFTFLFIFSN